MSAFPLVTIGNQWTHPELANDALMHAAVDARLNALRAFVNLQNNGMPRLRAGLATSQAIGASVNVPFDTISVDTGSGWNSSTHQWTCPQAGLYLISCALADTGSGVFYTSLNKWTQNAFVPYPNIGMASANSPASPTAGAGINAVPIWIAQGDTIFVQTSTAMTLQGNVGTVYLVIEPLLPVSSLTPPPALIVPGVQPLDPALASLDQWTQGEPVSDLKLTRRVDDKLNELANAGPVSWGGQFASFFGTTGAGTVYSAGQNVAFTPIYDNYGGYNLDATSNAFSFPPGKGVYIISAGLRANGAQDPRFNLVFTQTPPRQRQSSQRGALYTGTGASCSCIAVVDNTVGTIEVGVNLAAAGFIAQTAASSMNNWFAVQQIGWQE